MFTGEDSFISCLVHRPNINCSWHLCQPVHHGTAHILHTTLHDHNCFMMVTYNIPQTGTLNVGPVTGTKSIYYKMDIKPQGMAPRSGRQVPLLPLPEGETPNIQHLSINNNELLTNYNNNTQTKSPSNDDTATGGSRLSHTAVKPDSHFAQIFVAKFLCIIKLIIITG